MEVGDGHAYKLQEHLVRGKAKDTAVLSCQNNEAFECTIMELCLPVIGCEDSSLALSGHSDELVPMSVYWL